MDLISAFKSELFRPLATILVPGTIAFSPFLVVAVHYNPELPAFWNRHGAAFAALFVMAVTSVGFVLENVGTRIEKGWDAHLSSIEPRHMRDWLRYLQLDLRDEVVGQRYLRGVVTRMKFELACAPALLIGSLGLVWANALLNRWRWGGVLLLVSFAVLTSAFLLYESHSSAKVAASTRRLILTSRWNRRTNRASTNVDDGAGAQ
jgi:hypothetical protein